MALIVSSSSSKIIIFNKKSKAVEWYSPMRVLGAPP
jgi:hypothetical protein